MGAVKQIDAAQIIALPANHVWFDDAQAAAYLSYAPTYFQNKIICLPDFPKPRKVGGHGRRWNAQELSDWINMQCDDTDGRPRKRG